MRFELNLDIGRPIAYITGDPVLNGEIVHVCDADEEGNGNRIQQDEMDILIRDFFGHMKTRLNFVKLEQLRKALVNRVRPDDPALAAEYDRALLLVNGSKGREIILKPGGKMHLTFSPEEERQIFYITGMSGSGKSTLTGELAENYHKLFPDNEVYLFSNKPEDSALDRHEFLVRVPMDEGLYERPLTLDALRDSLVIFDDVEAISDKDLAKEIDRLKDLIMQQGRSYHISMVYISHLANDYKRTRVILNEAHCITVFPQMCSQYSLRYLMEKYLGFGRVGIKKLMSLPSRAVTIFKAPLVVVHDGGCYLAGGE